MKLTVLIMARKRYVDTRFWSDVWVVDDLNPLDRYLFLYFMTNEKTNIAGVYEISLRTITYESGIDKDEVLRMLKRLESRVVYSNGWVVLRNAIKNQSYKNPKVKTGIENALELCPKELLNYINCPNDWIPPVVKRDTGNLQIGFDSLSIGNEVLSHSDSDLDSNFNSDASPLFFKKQKPEKASPEAIEKFRQKRRDLGL